MGQVTWWGYPVSFPRFPTTGSRSSFWSPELLFFPVSTHWARRRLTSGPPRQTGRWVLRSQGPPANTGHRLQTFLLWTPMLSQCWKVLRNRPWQWLAFQSSDSTQALERLGRTEGNWLCQVVWSQVCHRRSLRPCPMCFNPLSLGHSDSCVPKTHMSFGNYSLTEGWVSDKAFHSLSEFPAVILHARLLNSDQGRTGSLKDSSSGQRRWIRCGDITEVLVICCAFKISTQTPEAEISPCPG